MSAPSPLLAPAPTGPSNLTCKATPRTPATSTKQSLAHLPFADQEAALAPPTEPGTQPTSGATRATLARLDRIQRAFGVDDAMDPKTCTDAQTDGAVLTTPSLEPEEASGAALLQSAQDNAAQSHENMRDAVEQQLLAFIAASGYLAESAKDINESSSILAFVTTAFEIVSGAMLGIALAKQVASRLLVFLKGALDKTFSATTSAAAGAVKKTGGKVQLGDFTLQQAVMIADAHRVVGTEWKVEDVRARILDCPRPQQAGASLVAATDAIRLAAFRRQYVQTMTSWIACARAAKGGDTGTLILHVDFDGRGGYAPASCELEGMGDGTTRALLAAIPGRGPQGELNALTLHEVLNASFASGGLRVRVIDDSHEPFEWDARTKGFTTDDAHLEHHHVCGWGASKFQRDNLLAMVVAHRFLFEELGAKTLAELGLH